VIGVFTPPSADPLPNAIMDGSDSTMTRAGIVAKYAAGVRTTAFGDSDVLVSVAHHLPVLANLDLFVSSCAWELNFYRPQTHVEIPLDQRPALPTVVLLCHLGGNHYDLASE
jgi:hypothetical protein